ncbi:MAG: HDIG domain-containing protein [Magnetococcales bacterium]|nr:HDIG domain-containing protein [Magnetococcales bacterium]
MANPAERDRDGDHASRGERRAFWRNFGLTGLMDFALFVILVSLVTLIYSPVALSPPELPEVGEIAASDIKAHQDLLLEDEKSTQARREAAAQSTPPVYDWDAGMMDQIATKLRDSLSWLAGMRSNMAAGGKDEVRQQFAQKLEYDLSETEFDLIFSQEKVEPLLADIQRWLLAHAHRRIVGAGASLAELERTPYTLRAIATGHEIKVSGTRDFITLEEFRRVLASEMAVELSDWAPVIRRFLLRYLVAQMRPNLAPNLSETKLRRQKAFDAVETVYFHARQGQVLVRRGEIVTETVRQKIEMMYQKQWAGAMASRVAGLAAVVGMFLWLSRLFLIRTSSAFPRDRRTLYLLGAILLVVSLFGAITLAVGQGLSDLFGFPPASAAYLPPAALGAALTSLIVGARLSLPGGSMVMGTVLSFLTALAANGGLTVFMYHAIGSLAGAASMRTCRRRYDVLRAGLFIALAQMAAVPVMEILEGRMPSVEWLHGLAMALSSGLLTGLLGLALIPLLETFFDVTTDSRLLELASGDHPLLKQLSLHAPGTYHHSVMMGNLAEAAAENIGANPLMARVMALYHDIGKMDKPHYFVENQSGENRHDHLSPSMSAKVIMSHTKTGVEMARRYRLGGPVLAAITEHQGTGILQYFFNKAMNEAAKRGDTVAEQDYRYPGPKPQSPESGILMMADSVEAAARTLRTPSPAQIQALVRRIVDHKIKDGQLDECRLTMRDIARIEEAFVRVLTLGFYHRRIEYPDQVKRPSGK